MAESRQNKKIASRSIYFEVCLYKLMFNNQFLIQSNVIFMKFQILVRHFKQKTLKLHFAHFSSQNSRKLDGHPPLRACAVKNVKRKITAQSASTVSDSLFMFHTTHWVCGCKRGGGENEGDWMALSGP